MARTDALVRELTEQVGLEVVDARRSAFTALACASGWSKARVGRYLGISRARVGQKVDKLLHYATTLENVPLLTALMKTCVRTKPTAGDYDALIEFDASEWENERLAAQMLALVEAALPAGDT